MLGHYDAGFTLRTYTHATRQKQEQAAEKMGNFMDKVMWKQVSKPKTAGTSYREVSSRFRLFPRVGHGVGQDKKLTEPNQTTEKSNLKLYPKYPFWYADKHKFLLRSGLIVHIQRKKFATI